jgi:ABC-type multidrug transport system ATPase subunit
MDDVVIKLENVEKRFGNLTALTNMNLSIHRGEIIGLVGPNGAGKTTTLKLIARLLNLTSGKIFIENTEGELQNIRDDSQNLIEVGYLIDIPHFYHTNPFILLKYIANIRNYNANRINSRIDNLLKTFDMYQWKYTNMKQFSKGMIQKIGFLTAIIHDPELVILDEPQTGLDPDARMKIRKYLIKLKNENKTILVSSHLLTEIGQISDKIALINEGRLLGFGALDNLERIFSTKIIFCELLSPIQNNKVFRLTEKVRQNLEQFFPKSETFIAPENIIYDNQLKTFKIRYDGLESSRSEILQILSTKFRSDFTISSFSESKSDQFEELYSKLKLITNDIKKSVE